MSISSDNINNYENTNSYRNSNQSEINGIGQDDSTAGNDQRTSNETINNVIWWVAVS